VIIKAKKLEDLPRIFIVVSEFNSEITSKLLDGATRRLQEYGISDEYYSIVYVRGAYEIPLCVKEVYINRKPDGIVALAAIIKGETMHYHFLANAVIKKLLDISIEFRLPISHAVLTCESEEQAHQRAGGSLGNRGSEAVDALISSISVINQLRPI
jgi:6,7-dimethyl-8-ribityllumazine synthase